MWTEQILNGLTIGLIYALVAVGYSLVFGILRLVNMAHGSVYAFGAHIALLFTSLKWGIVPAILVSLILTGVMSVAIDRVVLSPLRQKKSPDITALISTIGVSYIIQNGLMVMFGSQIKTFPNFLGSKTYYIANIKVTSAQLWILGISITLLIILTIIVKFSKIGLAMRAVEQNGKAASLMGIDVKFVITFTFFLGGVCAAVAGTLVAGYYQMVYPSMGYLIGLKAFSAAVFGGIGILYGSVIGGIIIGIAETISVALFGGGYRDAVAFVILIFVLIIKPTGLFGKKPNVKV